MRRIDLGKDNWATLRDPEDVPERLRRGVQKAIRRRAAAVSSVDLDAEDAEAMRNGEDPKRQAELAMRALVSMSDETIDGVGDFQVAAILALVSEWSFGLVTAEVALELPGRAYDVIRNACEPLVNAMFLDATPDPNPSAPTGSSNGSSSPTAGALPATSLTSSGPSNSSTPG